jgi:hypothetical protein
MREAATQDEVEHGVFELAAGGRRAGGDDAGELGRSAPTAQSTEDLDELRNAHAPLRLCLARGAAKPRVVEDGGDIGQRAGG